MMFEKSLIISVLIITVCVCCYCRGGGNFKSVRGGIPEQQQVVPEQQEVVAVERRSQEEQENGDGGQIQVTPPSWLPASPGDHETWKTWNISRSNVNSPHNIVHGPGGRGAGCVDMSRVNFTTITCSVTPKCSITPKVVTEGSLVCRTTFDMFTGAKEYKTTCIKPSRALPLDTCGCCGGDCPKTCTCTCRLLGKTMGGEDKGVLIRQGRNGTRCVPKEIATSFVGAMGGSCVTECP